LGVSALSANDVWAVGGDSGNTLVEHWNGSAWSIVASPNAGGSSYLTGVAAISVNDVWAVGASFVSGAEQTLIEHWDGTGWSVVAAPSPGSSTLLTGVSAVTTSDVWAVGHYFNGLRVQTLVEHWNGTDWSVVSSANVANSDNPLSAVSAHSADDAWAVGGNTQTLTEHWDGTAWSVVASPNIANTNNTLSGVAAISGNDVWAVGNYLDRFNTGAPLQTLIEHWDGTAWSIVSSPDVGTGSNLLAAVAADSLGDAWAVGSSGGPSWRTLILSRGAAQDTTPPVISVPGTITANATTPSGAVVTYSVSATDPDDAVASLTCLPASGSTFPIGTTTVNCSAADTNANTSSASFTVHVEGGAEQLADLLTEVAGVGPGTSVADKVVQAQSYVAAGDVSDACSKLAAFINEVTAQTGKTIPPAQAAMLTASANRIRNVLDC
jgi:hypothetical protein